jgi:hypothetical protein
MSKYGHRTINWLEAIVNKLGGEEAGDAFLRDELVVSKPVRVWKTWMTVKVGTFKNVEEIRQAIKAGGHFIGDWANDILGKPAFKVSETEQDIELVNVSVEELGFKDGARYADTCKRAFELGLEYCPAEVGPQWCIQQPKGVPVIVAMEAIIGSDTDLHLFDINRDGGCGQCLSTNVGCSDFVWHSSVCFLFLRRPKSV